MFNSLEELRASQQVCDSFTFDHPVYVYDSFTFDHPVYKQTIILYVSYLMLWWWDKRSQSEQEEDSFT